MIRNHVTSQHSSESLKIHVLYGYFYLKMNFTQLGKVYGKYVSTIKRWVDTYNKGEPLIRKKTARESSINSDQKES